jgi:Predicted permeases
MITDPFFYAVAIPAVLFVGLSKGGFGGAMALFGVPLMALAVSPVQAAAIMLPILIVMDAVSLWTWRHERDLTTLKMMLPGAMLGIGIGWATAAYVTEALIRLIVGLVALWFALGYFLGRLRARRGIEQPARGHDPVRGTLCGTISGFTSFVSHAGGPPFQIYALPLRHNPKTYTGTSVRFFAVVNAVKLIPYFALGQFDAANLKTSLALTPLAPAATLAGAFVVRRLKPQVFYPLMYAMILVTAVKLIADGTLHYLP